MIDEKPEVRSQETESWRELPAETLQNGQLRDGIAERLQRLQQAPHARLANLLGVRERDGRVFLAWKIISGKSLAESATELSEDDLYRVLRELIDAVEGLHQLGLVHGNLRGESVILADDGVYLTDASPLLWTDEQLDVAATEKLLRHALQQRGLNGPPQDTRSLRALAAFLDGGYLPDLADTDSFAQRIDRRTLAWAIVLILLGLTIAAGAAWYFQRRSGKLLQSAAGARKMQNDECRMQNENQAFAFDSAFCIRHSAFTNCLNLSWRA